MKFFPFSENVTKSAVYWRNGKLYILCCHSLNIYLFTFTSNISILWKFDAFFLWLLSPYMVLKVRQKEQVRYKNKLFNQGFICEQMCNFLWICSYLLKGFIIGNLPAVSWRGALATAQDKISEAK